MMAAERGHTETVNALIEAGAHVNVICKEVITQVFRYFKKINHVICVFTTTHSC